MKQANEGTMKKTVKMKFDDWKSENSNLIKDDAMEYGNTRIIDESKCIEFNGSRYRGTNKETMKRWIKRKTDTSIKPDNKNMFYSKGTKIELIKEKTIINCETNDIFAGEGNLKLIGTSHHTKDAWNGYWKNAVNLKSYTRYIKEKNRISLQRQKRLRHN